jgi:hypothetical protein
MKKYHYYNATEINLQQKICFDEQKKNIFGTPWKGLNKKQLFIYIL